MFRVLTVAREYGRGGALISTLGEEQAESTIIHALASGG